jgi:ABC-type multidrug transport system fused ATPase/permease subunit
MSLYNKINIFFKLWIESKKILGLTGGNIIIVLVGGVFVSASEVVSIAMFLPVFEYMSADGDINVLLNERVYWKYIINLSEFTGYTLSLGALLILVFSAIVIRQIIVYLVTLYESKIAYDMLQKGKIKLFNAYINSNIEAIEKIRAGDIINIISNEINLMRRGLMAPFGLFTIFAQILSLTYMSILLSYQMTFLIFILIIFVSVLPSYWLKTSLRLSYMFTNANKELSLFFTQRVKLIRMIKLLSLMEKEDEKFIELTNNQRDIGFKRSVVSAKIQASTEPLVAAFGIFIVYISISVYKLDIEIVGLFLIILLRLMPILKGMLSNINRITESIGPASSFLNLYDSIVRAKEALEKGDNLFNIESIAFDNVNYKYSQNHSYILNNVSFTINKSTINAIVGPSGSGKSTLIDLIPRLRLPSSGKILINGKNYISYNSKTLRQLISFVSQTPQMFHGSFTDHIMQGNHGATKEEVISAAKLAGCHEFIINSDHKYDSIIGEDGLYLSGGQRQRLDLARALLVNLPLLIFDEPTNGLDREAIDSFNNALKQIIKNRKVTIIIVTHDTLSNDLFDQIIVINKGRVRELIFKK